MIATALVLYLVPAVIGWWRHSQNSAAIFVLNLLTGWTLIGWIAAFIWACVSPVQAQYIDTESTQKTELDKGTVEKWLDTSDSIKPRKRQIF